MLTMIADGIQQVFKIIAVPPIDELDYAAYKHDKGYDDRKAEGIIGALFNTSVVQADARLAGSAIQSYSTTNTWNSKKRWALATGLLFGNISTYKNIIYTICVR